jgi:predicted RNA-binding Zn-ribbon protein involved in translation (DUF1610 family)
VFEWSAGILAPCPFKINRRAVAKASMKSRLNLTTWDEYRYWRKWFWIGFLTFAPGCLLISFPFMLLFQSELPAFLIACLWMAGWFYVANRISRFKCPRCGETFFMTPWFSNGFARRCMHCGLSKWASPEPSDVALEPSSHADD